MRPAAVPILIRTLLAAAGLTAAAPLLAEHSHGMMRPDSHVPIGVMGGSMHVRGALMFSLRTMRMRMAGNRDGTDDLSPEKIVTSVPNRLAGQPGQPPTLRVVPTEMDMSMHMIGAMYTPVEAVTLMAGIRWIDIQMKHLTFAGPTGSRRLGTFGVHSTGLGDSTLAALVRLPVAAPHMLEANLGMSLPTGSIGGRASVLTPTGATPTTRMPYPMQVGSGSWEFIPGLTWKRLWNGFSAGAQWQSRLRLNDNDGGYRLGHRHQLTSWIARPLGRSTSASLRLAAWQRGNLNGADPLIRAPIQTADPDRQRARQLDSAIGLNWIGKGKIGTHRLAMEFSVPLYQRLDGPQLKQRWQTTLGYQFAP